MQPTIVLTHRPSELDRYYSRDAVQALEQLGRVVTNPREAHLRPAELLALASDVTIVISEWATGMDRSYLQAADGLAAFIRSGVEVLNVDMDAATAQGVVVANTPGLYATPVVELVLGFMVDLARRVSEHNEALHAGRLSVRSVDFELSGKTLGIIGLGEIGRRLAELASFLEMRAIAFDPYVSASAEGFELVDLQTLMSTADFVSVHAKLTPKSRHLLSRRQLAWMKPTAYLINTSRGAIVDEAALLEALANNRIAGASLDVFEHESEQAMISNPLLKLPNVIVTPHIGGFTRETMERQARETVRLAELFLRGEAPPRQQVINPEVLANSNLRLLRYQRG